MTNAFAPKIDYATLDAALTAHLIAYSKTVGLEQAARDNDLSGAKVLVDVVVAAGPTGLEERKFLNLTPASCFSAGFDLATKLIIATLASPFEPDLDAIERAVDAARRYCGIKVAA